MSEQFVVGDTVRFKNRTQMMPYMTVEQVDYSSLFNDVRYKLELVQGWWLPENLVKYTVE